VLVSVNVFNNAWLKKTDLQLTVVLYSSNVSKVASYHLFERKDARCKDAKIVVSLFYLKSASCHFDSFFHPSLFVSKSANVGSFLRIPRLCWWSKTVMEKTKILLLFQQAEKVTDLPGPGRVT